MKARRDVFQAIADPTRREILTLLRRRAQNLKSIAEQFDISRQAVSLHIKILSECDLIDLRKEGRERYCHLKAEKLAEVAGWLEPFSRLWEDRFDQLDSLWKEWRFQNPDQAGGKD